MPVTDIAEIEVSCTVREGSSLSAWEANFESSAFSVVIRAGKAIFRFKYPLSSLDEAERRLRDFLHSWEGDLLLQGAARRRTIQIAGSSAPGHGSRAYAYLHATIGGPLAEANTRYQTPWRRHRYWELPLVASLIARYEDYRRGRERLSVAGFMILSALEHAFGGRSAAATALNVDKRTLSELGRLVSTVGTYRSARKMSANHELRELSDQEQWWLESALRELLRRAGEAQSGRGNPARLTPAELPLLGP
jgi:hypothetical protein